MHLLTVLSLANPGLIMRSAIFLSQGIFFNFFFLAYLISPRFCHRFVGYLEEEACKTYTVCLEDFDKGRLPKWGSMPAPAIARNYWRLPEQAKMRDVVVMLRADEMHHRDVNHTFAAMRRDEPNPFKPGH